MAFGDNFYLKEHHILPVALVSDPNNLLGGLGGGGGTSGLDYEVLVLANPEDITQPVVVVNDFNPTTGVYSPTFRNLNGSTYTGATPISPSGIKYSYSAPYPVCVNGTTTLTRTDVYTNNSSVVDFSIWQDGRGTVVAAPLVTDTVEIGVCNTGSSSTDFEVITGFDALTQNVIWDAINVTTVLNTFNFDIADNVASTEALSEVEAILVTEAFYNIDSQQDITAPFNFSFDTSALADGTYHIYTKVKYASGNEFNDIALTLDVNSGVPTLVTNHIDSGSHIGTLGTRSYHTNISEVVLYSDNVGTLLNIFELPLTGTPVSYVLAGDAFLLERPQVIVEEFTITGLSEQNSIVEKTLCMVDDTLNDGSVLIPFKKMLFIESRTGRILSTRRYTEDFTATYNVIGTEHFAANFSNDAVLIPRRQHLVGPITFNKPVTTQFISYKMRIVNDVLNPPMITDNVGSSPFYEGVESWGAQDSAFNLLSGTFDLTLNAGDEVTVLWTEIA